MWKCHFHARMWHYHYNKKNVIFSSFFCPVYHRCCRSVVYHCSTTYSKLAILNFLFNNCAIFTCCYMIRFSSNISITWQQDARQQNIRFVQHKFSLCCLYLMSWSIVSTSRRQGVTFLCSRVLHGFLLMLSLSISPTGLCGSQSWSHRTRYQCTGEGSVSRHCACRRGLIWVLLRWGKLAWSEYEHCSTRGQSTGGSTDCWCHHTGTWTPI